MGSQYTHLTLREREQIDIWRHAGWTMKRIAAQLSRSQSTISRECRRGYWDFVNRYAASAGADYYQNGRRRAGAARRKMPTDDMTSPLWQFCIAMLHNKLSPEQISGVLRHCRPLSSTLVGLSNAYVSAQTIYTAIADLPRSQVRSQLTRHLRHSTKGRRRRRSSNLRSPILQDFVPIDARAELINSRAQSGHLEADLMVGARGKSYLGVIVERKSRRVWLVKLDCAHPAHVRERFTQRLLSVPRHMRRSMTYDRGSEMAQHKQLSEELQMRVFFCNPHSPWQRGTVENTNGLLRQYFPKGTDFSSVSESRLMEVEQQLNDRPRKMFAYRSALQVYDGLTQRYAARQAQS